MESKSKRYNVEYYKRNRHRLKALRAKKYREDKVYRTKAAKRRRKWYFDRKAKLGGRVIRKINGQVFYVYKIGKAAKLAGIDTKTIVKWETKGIIPAYDGRFGVSRCYTDAQVQVLIHVANLSMTLGSEEEVQHMSESFVKENWIKG